MKAGIKQLARNGRGYKLSISRQITEALGWRIGDPIYMQINADDTVTLRKVELVEIQPTPIEARP